MCCAFYFFLHCSLYTLPCHQEEVVHYNTLRIREWCKKRKETKSAQFNKPLYENQQHRGKGNNLKTKSKNDATEISCKIIIANAYTLEFLLQCV